ncbi:MAG: DNA-directed RNA polymerase subunit omega, partial [Ectothiorhodospira sp.]
GGSQPHLDWENDKPTVVALREIAEGRVGREVLDEVAAREHAEASRVDEEEVRTEIQ